MTTPKDIIGIVKELQNSTDHCDVVEAEITKHFPEIAEALLIAVEALENIRQTHMQAATEPQGFTSVSSERMCQSAGLALYRINYLSVE